MILPRYNVSAHKCDERSITCVSTSHAVSAIPGGEGTHQEIVARQDRAGHDFAWQRRRVEQTSKWLFNFNREHDYNPMGLSENVGYIPKQIAIFDWDNDQQNHWVQWGTLFSDTPQWMWG
jgi:hypothetical protein